MNETPGRTTTRAAQIDPVQVMAEHKGHRTAHWGQCIRTQVPAEPCEPYRLAEALVAEQARAAEPSIDVDHLNRQREWSRSTFGPGPRTLGVLDHIREELDEVEAAPHDVEEWADVLILAFDGAWRAGHEPAEIIGAIKAKQQRNEQRTWPDWRTQSADHKIKALPDQPEQEQPR